MSKKQKNKERLVWTIITLILLVALWYVTYLLISKSPDLLKSLGLGATKTKEVKSAPAGSALDELKKLPVKEAESGEDYERSEFSSGWASWGDCNVRQKILNRDVKDKKLAANDCTVVSGNLDDPYTGETIEMKTKTAVSRKVQIDHVVALGNAWKTGGKHLSADKRKELANDDLELIAVSSAANQEKSDMDASEWLPAYKPFQCQYVARQIAVKIKYSLWVTLAEHNAMVGVLKTCPDQKLPAE